MLFSGPTACSFLSISPVAVCVAHPRFCSRGVGGGRCSNVLIVLTTLRLLAKRVYVTCCRCWHVALSLLLNRGAGWGGVGWVGWGGGCNNVPDGFKTVGHKGPCNLLPLLQKLGQLFKTKNSGWRNTKQGRRKYESFEGRCWNVACFSNVDLIVAISRRLIAQEA